jgi:hypothetical protein
VTLAHSNTPSDGRQGEVGGGAKAILQEADDFLEQKLMLIFEA